MSRLTTVAIGVLGSALLAVSWGCSEPASSPDPSPPVESNETPDTPSQPESVTTPVAEPADDEVSTETRESPAEPLTLETFPMPAGTSLVMTNADVRSMMLRGPNTLDDYVQFFESKLPELGWKKDEQQSEIVESVGFLDFTKGELRFTLTLNPDNDGETMAITAVGPGISVPEDEEDEFPDDAEFDAEGLEEEEFDEDSGDENS